MVGLDEYERKARLTPGLLLVVPVSVVVVALGLKSYPAVSAIGGILIASGGTYVLAMLVRSVGAGSERDLWESWGGSPTTAALRTRSEVENPDLRHAWRSAVERVTGCELLAAELEAEDPAAADRAIEVAVRQLLGFGQDERYPLVRQENIHYGFERNLLAVRWVGRLIAAVCLALLVTATIWPPEFGTDRGSAIAGLVINSLFLLGWCVIPSAARTRAAAERYAKHLLQATARRARELDGAQ